MKWIWAMGTLWFLGAAIPPHAETAPDRCALCASPLVARYWSFEGDPQAYCDRCVQTKPRCYGCGKPQAEGTGFQVRGAILCGNCAAARPHCGDCRNPILKKYFQVTGIQECYCDHCFLNHPHCRFCGRPFLSDRQPAVAVGPVCGVCRSEAVTDPKSVESWIRDIRTWMETELGLKITQPLRFRVDDEIEQSQGRLSGDAYQELGAFVVEGDRRSVVLVQGLPKTRLIETVAHELAHAWQWEMGVRDQLLEHKEGFAQWVAGKALRRFGHGDAVVVLRERPDLYGEGFRMFEEIERRKGIPAVLSYAKSAK